jgi:hypothetical protein
VQAGFILPVRRGKHAIARLRIPGPLLSTNFMHMTILKPSSKPITNNSQGGMDFGYVGCGCFINGLSV